MKVFILKKSHIFITLFLLLSIFISISFFNIPSISFAIMMEKDGILNADIKNKFCTLQKQKEKIAYLTFDDGPTLKATSKILDILKEEDVKASFFVVGKHVKEHPELVKNAYDEGHFIANHGYSHNNSKLYQSDESFISEVKNTDIEIGKALNIDNYCSHVFRFPNGYMSNTYISKKKHASKLLCDMEYVYVDWNCLNKDSEKKYSNHQLLNNLKKSSKNKGTLIILMHDTNDVNNTTSILKDSILYLKQEGYKFCNFYNLINLL